MNLLNSMIASGRRDRNARDSFFRRVARVQFAVMISTGSGGSGRDRTDDLRLAKAALPQLSYSPGVWWA